MDRIAPAAPLAATNQDLEKLVDQGQFRHDLYYRLGVFTIRLPIATESPSLIMEESADVD